MAVLTKNLFIIKLWQGIFETLHFFIVQFGTYLTILINIIGSEVANLGGAIINNLYNIQYLSVGLNLVIFMADTRQ